MSVFVASVRHALKYHSKSFDYFWISFSVYLSLVKEICSFIYPIIFFYLCAILLFPFFLSCSGFHDFHLISFDHRYWPSACMSILTNGIPSNTLHVVTLSEDICDSKHPPDSSSTKDQSHSSYSVQKVLSAIRMTSPHKCVVMTSGVVNNLNRWQGEGEDGSHVWVPGWWRSSSIKPANTRPWMAFVCCPPVYSFPFWRRERGVSLR